MLALENIQKNFRGHIALQEPLKNYTSFRIGGPADLYLEPIDKSDAIELLRHFQSEEIPFIIIGNGSNLLVSDEGVRHPVINVEKGLGQIYLDADRVVVEAGVRMAKFVDFCIQRGYQGVEMLAGIPGTMGGAIVMNAGAYGGEISDHLLEVEILRCGKLVRVPKSEAGFSYRRSGFQRDVVLSATFKLPPGDRAELIKRRRELLIKRNQAQPINLPNSGSIFKNPGGHFAAKLIEEVGLKGKKVGGAQISEKHGNFIVNTGNATAEDVLNLIRLARTTVRETTGITLELEVKLLGFPESVQQEFFA